MKNFFKTTIFLLLTSMIIQSCTSKECDEEIISDEQKITTELTEKIINTATFVNDYNFFINNADSGCAFLATYASFNNTEGDFFSFNFGLTESLDMWISQYNDAKLRAFNTTGVAFTDEDFFLRNLGDIFFINTREQYLEYFTDCSIDISANSDYFLPFSDINLNCESDAELSFRIVENDIVIGSIGNVDLSTNNLTYVEDLLTNYNTQNNTDYGLENVSLSFLRYTAPNNQEVALYESKYLLNYFENCMLSRDGSINDCLNFVYPLQINRFNLQLEEVITTTIENNEDLITTFNTNVGELGFVFPISLLGANGDILTIETNEALESALDNSSMYCN